MLVPRCMKRSTKGKTDLEEASTALYAASSKGSSFDPGSVLICSGPSNVARFRSTQDPRYFSWFAASVITSMLTGSSAPVTACPGANEPAAHGIATAIASMMQRHISTRSSGSALPTTYYFLSDHGPTVTTVHPDVRHSQERNKHARWTEVSSLHVAHHALTCCVLTMRAEIEMSVS